jgi:rhodanese-related sulfurtransferase
MEPQILLIDIRRDSEVFNKRIDTERLVGAGLYVIPMNMIRFNRDTIIQHLKWVTEIYLVCDTGRRSAYIKAKYFADIPAIKVSPELQFSKFQHGINNVSIHNGSNLTIPVIGNTGIYSLTRLIQIMMGTVIGLSACIALYNLDRKCVISRYALIVVLLFAGMALFNGLTDTCTLSMLLRDYLN